jgi:hypothetical protein
VRVGRGGVVNVSRVGGEVGASRSEGGVLEVRLVARVSVEASARDNSRLGVVVVRAAARPGTGRVGVRVARLKHVAQRCGGRSTGGVVRG